MPASASTASAFEITTRSFVRKSSINPFPLIEEHLLIKGCSSPYGPGTVDRALAGNGRPVSKSGSFPRAHWAAYAAGLPDFILACDVSTSVSFEQAFIIHSQHGLGLI